MKKIFITGISLIGIVFILSGCSLTAKLPTVQIDNTANNTKDNVVPATDTIKTENLATTTKQDSSQSTLGVKLEFAKNTYQVGEQFVPGDFKITYSGKPLDILAIVEFSRTGYTKKFYSTTRVQAANQIFGTLGAFKIDSSGYDSTIKAFSDPGSYTYNIYVFDCQEIEKTMNKACKSIDLHTDTANAIKQVAYLAKDEQTITIVGEATTNKDTIPLKAEVKTDLNTNNNTAVLDCKNDLSCFINASRNCNPAKLTLTTGLDLGGIKASSITYQEIKGPQAGGCSFYIKYLDASISYSPEMKNELVKQGSTLAEVNAQEQEAQKQQKIVIGRNGTCLYKNNADLTQMLTNWQKGSYSSEDFDKGNCTGSYFDNTF